ncbi:MAG TPA: hypothetical protein VN089_20180 [Duganella sp.]|nr:hypothetical protein [Duganella sp.]
MKPFHRRVMLYGLLVSAASFALWVANADGTQAGEIVAVPARVAPARPVEATTAITDDIARLPLEKMTRTFVAANDGNPFSVKSWTAAVASPAPSIPLTAPVPVAPSLPYSFAGKLELEGGKWVVYLEKGEQSFAVNKGETFDGSYRLDGIENGNLVIVYLPLNIKQLLPIGAEISE